MKQDSNTFREARTGVDQNGNANDEEWSSPKAGEL